jgi:hypothetical protein
LGSPFRAGETLGIAAPASAYENRSEVLRGVEWWRSAATESSSADTSTDGTTTWPAPRATKNRLCPRRRAARGRASSSTSTSSASAGSSVVPASGSLTGCTSATTPPGSTPRVSGGSRSAGVRARLRRRLQSTRLRRGAPGREGDHRDRLLPTRDPLLRAARDQCRTSPHRQRQRLRVRSARARLQAARDQAHPHPPLPAADERQRIERFIRTLLAGWAYGAV